MAGEMFLRIVDDGGGRRRPEPSCCVATKRAHTHNTHTQSQGFLKE